MDGIVDPAACLRIDKIAVVACYIDADRHAEHTGEGFLNRLRAFDDGPGAGSRNDADAEDAHVLAPAGFGGNGCQEKLGRAKEQSERDCQRPCPAICLGPINR